MSINVFYGAQEFGNGSSTEAEGKSFAAAVNETKADGKTRTNELETVVRISGSSAKKEAEHAANASATAAAASGDGSGGGGDGGSTAASTTAGSGGGSGSGGTAGVKEEAMAEVEKSVDRIIDSHDNEFVLSKSGSGLASLTLDPQVGRICPHPVRIVAGLVHP